MEYKTAEVDSLKLRIPISQVSNLRADIISNRTLQVAEITGEVTGIKNKGHRIRIGEAATIHTDIQKSRTSTGSTIECLIILLNAKILEERYLEGITKDNLQIVYNKLMDAKLFSFTWDTFIESECTDIDIKIDTVMNEAERINTVKVLKSIVMLERTDSVNTYSKPTKKNKNSIGIQFGRRGKEFIKLYSKGAESRVKDAEAVTNGEIPFFDTYFNYKDLEDIFRIEVTVKDKLNAKKFGITSLKLGDIVHWSESLKINIFKKMLSKYITGIIIANDAKPKDERLTPADIVYFTSMAFLIETTGTTAENVVSSLIKNIHCSVSKSRMKTKLMKIYKENIEGTKFDASELTKKTGSYLSKFGIG